MNENQLSSLPNLYNSGIIASLYRAYGGSCPIVYWIIVCPKMLLLSDYWMEMSAVILNTWATETLFTFEVALFSVQYKLLPHCLIYLYLPMNANPSLY